jgi:deuterolysin
MYGGQSVAFSGVLLQLSMKYLTADSFVTIPAGQSVSVTHTNIGSLYEFHEAGTGTFTFTPRQDLQVAGVDSFVSEIAKIVGSCGPSVDIHVDSDVGKRDLRMRSNLDKRDTVDCSDSGQSSFISASWVTFG